MTAVAPATAALLLFPDDFEAPDVVAQISKARVTRPRLLLIVITGTPQRFRDVLAPDGRSLVPILLPRPAFGWTILDTIRAHAH